MFEYQDMLVGTRYVVTKSSDDKSFLVGDHISRNIDGSIDNREAQGWVDVRDIDEATKRMKVEIDRKWVEQRKAKLLKELSALDEQ